MAGRCLQLWIRVTPNPRGFVNQLADESLGQ